MRKQQLYRDFNVSVLKVKVIRYSGKYLAKLGSHLNFLARSHAQALTSEGNFRSRYMKMEEDNQLTLNYNNMYYQ